MAQSASSRKSDTVESTDVNSDMSGSRIEVTFGDEDDTDNQSVDVEEAIAQTHQQVKLEQDRRSSLEKKLAVLEESAFDSDSDGSLLSDDLDYSTVPGNDSMSVGSVTSTALNLIPRHILASKWLVAAILVGSTCILGYFVYYYTTGEQTKDFQAQFEEYANQVLDQSLTNLIETFLVLSSFSRTVTSLTLHTNETWPMVSLPHFETRASDFLLLSKTRRISLAPLVSDGHRQAWESYTVNNQDWIQEGIDFQNMMVASTAAAALVQQQKQQQHDQNNNHNRTATTSVTAPESLLLMESLGEAKPIQPYIWQYNEEPHNNITNRRPVMTETSTGPYLPIWQTYAPPRSSMVVNFNLLSTPLFRELVKVSTQDRRAVLSGIVENNKNTDTMLLLEEDGLTSATTTAATKEANTTIVSDGAIQTVKGGGRRNLLTTFELFSTDEQEEQEEEEGVEAEESGENKEQTDSKRDQDFYPATTTTTLTTAAGTRNELVVVNPQSVILQPVLESLDVNSPIVAYLVVIMTWDIIFQNVLPNGSEPIICVLQSSCRSDKNNDGDAAATTTTQQMYTYEISGHDINFLGEGDYHDEMYDHLVVSSSFATEPPSSSSSVSSSLQPPVMTSLCNFTLHIYPTEAMEEASYSSMPVYITLAVISMFAFTTLIFLLYDLMVQRQQSTLAATAMRTTEILGSLFPQEVHDRLFASPLGASEKAAHSAPKYKMRKMVSDEDKHKPHGDDREGDKKSKDAPIADLFPECTVMFCDISGFTAWSSVREPSQVFQLLETVYNAFDIIANRRGVFKVETIGDSYLAVTGLPSPRDDHAVAMVKFANDCLIKMQELTQMLELELGPGTGELTMRFGLHSGPVTAGVLRGEKTRFQLFGDTVNTASRMESTGERDKIQVSQETADLLIAAGRERWIKARETKVMAKGKGELQTYWVCPRVPHASGHDTFHNSNGSVGKVKAEVTKSTVRMSGIIASAKGLDDRKKRAVHWISEIMVKLLKQILARRAVSGWNINMIKMMNYNEEAGTQHVIAKGKHCVDEIQDVITLPKFDRSLARRQADCDKIKLPDAALEQLHSYISLVALNYQDNPFHSIDHAAHVCMSTVKLLARIVAPETLDPAKEDGRTFEARRHDHTYGITSDPLTQFACVFASLIHDADHPGCPNASLVKEKTDLAVKYKNKSVAEQNSFDLCWDMLMQDRFKDLRACIYSSPEEGKRFRQIVVNCIIATDISDKNLSAQRKSRWNKAFDENADQFQDESCSATKTADELAEEAINRKATIVIEHLIQASDVAHTMQHWHIYTKWNEKLFQEMYKAFVDGRIEKDPADSWYDGELGFYDFYIIPLAKKLKECGVFGVSSAEYLNYAVANRREWEVRGKEVVAGYVKKYGKPAPPKRSTSSKSLSPTPSRRGRRASLGRAFSKQSLSLNLTQKD